MIRLSTVFALASLPFVSVVAAQQHPAMPAGMTHGEMPPGVTAMQRLQAQIAYTFEQTERGGAVRITTSNAEALNAVHEFLRYQIKEHATGDPVTVQK